MVLGTGAAANLSRLRLLEHHNRILEQRGYRKVSTCPSPTSFRFGDGRQGEVRRAADTPVGAEGSKGKFTASVLDTDSPALLRKGALEALGPQLEPPRDL